jgi:hypothetical protein
MTAGRLNHCPFSRVRHASSFKPSRIRTEVTLLYPENHIQQTDERRDLDQWPDDANEGFAGFQAEEGYGYGDGQLELLPAVVNKSVADCA